MKERMLHHFFVVLDYIFEIMHLIKINMSNTSAILSRCCCEPLNEEVLVFWTGKKSLKIIICYNLLQTAKIYSASTGTFTVTGLPTLPIAMVYAGKPEVSNKVSGIATSEAGAKGFVERLVRQTVFDVLESQGRSALLPDAVISGILGQLTVTVTYELMKCQEVILDLANDMTYKEKI
ncbi:hypothetical protein KIN20_029594 [Parelaphostrongylus tenuis]|uniref:Uncharacterized protein n=1 Tax=Parelaphostrongylus tenuis TaxID=148309 RepID=A0AAD5R302_PARTN|nr:hypothetical protein KIN20_029594 [Parelaphostrongylus tenuis]